MAGDVPAVVNAVKLLERIARDWPDPVASGALIDELDLNRSTAYSILGTLQRAGWTATKGDRAGWSLGPRLLALAPVAEDWLATIVKEELDQVSHQLGFLAFAVQRNGENGYAVIARAERGKGIHISVGIGDTFPFSAPAIMRAFLAWQDPADAGRLVDRHGLQTFTPETVADVEALHRVLEDTRKRGYGMSIREYDLGQSGVSAPVFDANGRVNLVLCALAFASELNETNADEHGALLRDCGLRITSRIGGTVPD
jgi:IclR family acetate operon transcriptional repressor